MRDTLERAIEAAIRSGATPKQIAQIILEHSESLRSTSSETDQRLAEFQKKVAAVIAGMPAFIEVKLEQGSVKLERRIEHSIATNTISVGYMVPNTEIGVREVLYADDVPEVLAAALSALQSSAADMVDTALNRTVPRPEPRAHPCPEITEACPHADV